MPEEIRKKRQKFADISDELRTGLETVGVGAAVISERAQVLADPNAEKRFILTRTCNTRGPEELFLLPMQKHKPGQPLPGNVEFLAFDRSSGVYNYYAVEGITGQDIIDKTGKKIPKPEPRAWRFFGNYTRFRHDATR